MKAIIISDSDARALLDQLKLEAVEMDAPHVVFGLPPEEVLVPAVRSEVHRRFHYVVTRWLQEMGADVLHR